MEDKLFREQGVAFVLTTWPTGPGVCYDLPETYVPVNRSEEVCIFICYAPAINSLAKGEQCTFENWTATIIATFILSHRRRETASERCRAKST